MSASPKGRRPAPAHSGCGGCLGGLVWLILAVIFWRWVLVGLAMLPVLYLLSVVWGGVAKSAFTSPGGRD